jgi:hypothetical protein
MKHSAVTSLFCALLGLCSLASGQTVQIQQPSNNASLDWPFQLQASCSTSDTITGWDVYLDSNSTPYYRNTLNSKTLNILVQASTGSHTLQAKCWVGNLNGYANVDVDVIGGGLIPMPPSTANAFWNVDDDPINNGDATRNWESCISGCGSQPDDPTLTDVSSPSLDGKALDANQLSGGSKYSYWGILWYDHMGEQDSSTNFEAQWSFRVNSGANPQALEFDFPVWIGGKSYYFGTQCNRLGSPSDWDYWVPTNPAGKQWVSTGIPCSISTAAWHTVKWYGTIDTAGPNYTYVALQFDTAQYNISQKTSAGTISYGDNFTVQFQPDGDSAGDGYSEYVDEVSAWTW